MWKCLLCCAFSGDITAENVRSRTLQREMDAMINDLQNVLWFDLIWFFPVVQLFVHVDCIFLFLTFRFFFLLVRFYRRITCRKGKVQERQRRTRHDIERIVGLLIEDLEIFQLRVVTTVARKSNVTQSLFCFLFMSFPFLFFLFLFMCTTWATDLNSVASFSFSFLLFFFIRSCTLTHIHTHISSCLFIFINSCLLN